MAFRKRLGTLFLAFAAALGLAAQERFLDAPRPQGDGPRLVVFNPSVHNIRCLAALRDKGLLAPPELTVVGVHHARQREDFAAARRWIADKRLDWMKLHTVDAPLDAADAFQANAASPEFRAILAKADGVIFFGGSDIPPALYGQGMSLLSDCDDPWRNLLELSAMWHLLGGRGTPAGKALLASRPAFPVLGICLGFQSLNVATGGTLVQDIWTGLYGCATVEEAVALGPERWHNNPHRRLRAQDGLIAYNFHSLQFKAQGRLLKALGVGPGDHPRVLSSHHQALGALGQDWQVIATSRDGKVVEAFEHQVHPNVLGVQFHPEHYLLWDPEARHRQVPGEAPFSYPDLLAATPPSQALHGAIWRWFSEALQASHRKP